MLRQAMTEEAEVSPPSQVLAGTGPVPKNQRIHSRIGIASCVVGGGMFLLLLAGIVYQLMEGRMKEAGFESGGLSVFAFAVVFFLPLPVHVIGLVLGVVSLFFPKRKKLFPVLGVILNFLFGVFSLGPLIFLALKMGGVR